MLLLAFYQLCISAVATSDERTPLERRLFLTGTLALTLPLLLLPLRSGGLLWRGDLNDRWVWSRSATTAHAKTLIGPTSAAAFCCTYGFRARVTCGSRLGACA